MFLAHCGPYVCPRPSNNIMESGSGIGGQSGLSARFGVAKIWAVTTTECFSYPVPATPCCLDWMTRGRLVRSSRGGRLCVSTRARVQWSHRIPYRGSVGGDSAPVSVDDCQTECTCLESAQTAIIPPTESTGGPPSLHRETEYLARQMVFI